MKKLCLLLCVVAFQAVAEERILSFKQDIRIARDGALTVTERIELVAEGREIRRGILRDFPTMYEDRRGMRTRVPFEVLAVARDGRPENYALEPLSNGERIRIGRASVLLDKGVHVYEITYRTARQLGFFETHDELYWNVNGTGWTFPFDLVHAEVALPAPVPAEKIRVEAYTGRQGARGRDYVAQAREGGASFRTTRTLAPREGLTIVVGFPKGVVAPPSAAERARWWAADNRGVLAGVLGVPLLFGFLFWRWHLVGRDPRAGPKYPRYQPPAEVGAAGVRYIDRQGYDDRCFAAGLLGLGARGFLRIRQSGEQYGIERTGTEPGQWLPGEQTLAQWLLPGGKSAVQVLSKTHDPAVAIARESFASALAVHFGKQLFSRNHGSFAAGIVLAVGVLLAMLFLGAPSAAIFLAGGVMIVMLFLFKRWLPAYSVKGRKLQDHIEGLRLYLAVAETEDLKRMKAPPQTAAEFAKLLPYAVALDVEKTWADRFAATLGTAAVAAAVANYYQSDTGVGHNFGGRIGESMSGLSSTVASASTAPGSDSGFSSSGGGGGGGSSGGGGGGGGGSGW